MLERFQAYDDYHHDAQMKIPIVFLALCILGCSGACHVSVGVYSSVGLGVYIIMELYCLQNNKRKVTTCVNYS